MDPLIIIQKYYDQNSKLYNILVNHSRSVADKAASIISNHPELNIDKQFVEEAAMLHDIGIFKTNAPGIECYGTYPYMCHGYLGADILCAEGYKKHALVAERHTGTGLKSDYIIKKGLPLPDRQYCFISIEEQLICFADIFFSKTRLGEEKSIKEVEVSLSRWEDTSMIQFKEWCKLFL